MINKENVNTMIKILDSIKNGCADITKEDIQEYSELIDKVIAFRENHNAIARKSIQEKRKLDKMYCRSKKEKEKYKKNSKKEKSVLF